MITKEELRPCPFCCNEARYRKYDCMGKDRWTVHCPSPFCPGFTAASNCEDPKCAMNLWNTRPIEDTLRAELARKDELIAALRELVSALDLSRIIWTDMYHNMLMLPEDRRAMENGTHKLETAVAEARARLAEVEGEK